MTSSHLYVLLNRLYVSVCSNESLNHQYRHYLQLVESLELLWAEQWFQFLDFVQVTNNDPNIDQQQYQVPLNQDIHDFGMVTTKPAKKRFFSRIKSVIFCLQLSVVNTSTLPVTGCFITYAFGTVPGISCCGIIINEWWNNAFNNKLITTTGLYLPNLSTKKPNENNIS